MRLRVLKAGSVFQRDAAGVIRVMDTGAVIEASDAAAKTLLSRGLVEVVASEPKRKKEAD
jgi:hypothetical protein